jgi:formate--tetrahydrofolate ligase
MSDIEIARAAKKIHIRDVAAKVNIPEENLIPYGHDAAKINFDFIEKSKSNPDGKLILVTAINPTPAGEGKTTTSVGLNDGLNKIGKKSIVCLREPSLGPCFGMKGGAAGGGYAQVVPMEDINLHFTGDFHAITSAHNLLSAMIDNHIYWGNKQEIDPRRVTWKRVLDTNDRALRNIVVSLGGVSNGFPRESGFDITVASEIMAIFCLSENLEDLEKRLGDIIIGYRKDKSPVFCRDIGADGAMTVLLKEALQPNLVQTLENNPAFIHGGPFANIAHGCNSVVATRAGLELGDYVITEAGFGADLGAEKFLNIKCRKANLKPDAVVIVATIRALKMNGGIPKDQLSKENVGALEKGSINLLRHIENIKKFNLPVIVGINHFVSDTNNEVEKLLDIVSSSGSEAIVCKHWSDGSEGTKQLAQKVVGICDSNSADFQPLYRDDLPLIDKIKCVATEIYRAADISANKKIINQLNDWAKAGYGNLPICMAKTQYSFSADPNLLGAPEGHIIPIREVRLSAGAGFIVVICGDIMTMPGLPSVPAAEKIHIDKKNLVQGLF